jgi:hypothetical protein
MLDKFWSGDVICDIGQLNSADRAQLDKLVRKGIAKKWRGFWYPVPGATAYGFGPLKTCWALADHYG